MRSDVDVADASELVADDGARPRKILHVDLDASSRPWSSVTVPSSGFPVAVGGSRERGVIGAACYEACVFGVRSAMPSVTARRKCPFLIFVKPRFDAYKVGSIQIREIFAETPRSTSRSRLTRPT